MMTHCGVYELLYLLTLIIDIKKHSVVKRRVIRNNSTKDTEVNVESVFN